MDEGVRWYYPRLQTNAKTLPSRRSSRYKAVVGEFTDVLHGWWCVDQLNRDFWGRTDWEWLHRDAGEKGNSGGFDDSDDDDDDEEEEDGDSDSTGEGSEGEVRMG
jgi:hypothetical protein